MRDKIVTAGWIAGAFAVLTAIVLIDSALALTGR